MKTSGALQSIPKMVCSMCSAGQMRNCDWARVRVRVGVKVAVRVRVKGSG